MRVLNRLVKILEGNDPVAGGESSTPLGAASICWSGWAVASTRSTT